MKHYKISKLLIDSTVPKFVTEKNCVLVEQNNNMTGVNFMITSTKLYVSIVTLSINDNITFLEKRK